MTRIGIFWDYENCPPPRGISGYDVVANIKHAISDLGDEITTFKAYVDIHKVISQSSVCQTELQSAGVTLVHCPHACRKEAADRVLCVDLMMFALEHSQPTSIVLISGDKDFSYATSRLRMKGHQVYLIHPSYCNTATSILNVASGTREWSSILSKRTKFEKSPDAAHQTLLVIDKKHSNPFGNDSPSPNHATSTRPSLIASKSPEIATRPLSSLNATPVGQSQGARTNGLSTMIMRPIAQNRPHLTGTPTLTLQPPPSRCFNRIEEPVIRNHGMRHSHDNPSSSLPPKPFVASTTSSAFNIGTPIRVPWTAFSAPPQHSLNMLPPKAKDPPFTSSFWTGRGSAYTKRKSKFKPINSVENAAEAFRTRLKIDENREKQEIAKTAKQALSPAIASSAANIPPTSDLRTSFCPLIDVLLLERKHGKMSTPISTLDQILKEKHPKALVDFGAKDIRDYVESAEIAGAVFFSDVSWKDGRGYVSLRNPQLYGDTLVVKAQAPLAKLDAPRRRMVKARIEDATEHFLRVSLPGLLSRDGDSPHFSKDGVTSLLAGFMGGMRSLRSSHGSGTMTGAPPIEWKTYIGKRVAANEVLFRTLIDSAKASRLILVRKTEGEGGGGLELHPDIC